MRRWRMRGFLHRARPRPDTGLMHPPTQRMSPRRGNRRGPLPGYARPTLFWRACRDVVGKGWAGGSSEPGGTEREPGIPVRVGLDGEHLVQLDLVALERQPRPGHVEPPDLRGALTHLAHALVPVGLEVLAPALEGQRVVLAEVLLVAHLEPEVLDLGDDPAGAGQLAVGEH